MYDFKEDIFELKIFMIKILIKKLITIFQIKILYMKIQKFLKPTKIVLVKKKEENEIIQYLKPKKKI